MSFAPNRPYVLRDCYAGRQWACYQLGGAEVMNFKTWEAASE